MSTPTESTPLVRSSIRVAFDDQDGAASRIYHDLQQQNNNKPSEMMMAEGHQSEGGYLKPIIFGGLDGILTSFAIVGT